MKKAPMIVMIIFFFIFSLVYPLNAAKLIDKIVATVNGEPITLYELKNIAGFYKAKTPQELLNKVIDNYLIMEYAKNIGITVTKSDIMHYMKNLAAQNNLSLQQFIETIKKSGLDLSYYKKGIKLLLYKIKFSQEVFLPSITITPQEIKRYYKLHEAQLEPNSKIAVLSIITLNNLKEAQKVYSLLQKGENFETLLEKYSISKEKTRDIPINALNPYLQKQILSLIPGKFTRIIESAGKFYIVKLIGFKENPYIEEEIRNTILNQKIKAKLKSWLKLIRARSDIEIYLK